MKVKKHDFIEIEYIGKIKETDKIFDLTSEKLAKEKNLYNPNIEYKPKIICVGENFIIPGLDKRLIGKETNKTYTLEIPAIEAFGKKDPKLIRLVSTSKFKDKNIRPFPGLQLNIDGFIGTIRTVSGGRITIDFNHPLAGHNLIYEIKINKIIKDIKTKLKSIVKLFFKKEEVELKEDLAIIKADIPEKLQKILEDKIKKLIPKIKKVKFEKETKKK